MFFGFGFPGFFPLLIEVTPRMGDENADCCLFVTSIAHKRGLREFEFRAKKATMSHRFACEHGLSEEVALDSSARGVSFHGLVIFPGKIISNIAR
jgi:hypothetical protein